MRMRKVNIYPSSAQSLRDWATSPTRGKVSPPIATFIFSLGKGSRISKDTSPLVGEVVRRTGEGFLLVDINKVLGNLIFWLSWITSLLTPLAMTLPFFPSTSTPTSNKGSNSWK
jgi:hypothetical protein